MEAKLTEESTHLPKDHHNEDHQDNHFWQKCFPFVPTITLPKVQRIQDHNQDYVKSSKNLNSP